MTTLANYQIVIILVAIVVGLIVAFWAFGRRGSASKQGGPAPSARAASRDGPEGNGLTDEYAAAAENVAGEMLGVGAHPEIPGPSGPPDDLQRLKGVGPKLAAQLNELGITRYDQLARLGENEAAMLDDRLGAFKGRIARDRLVEQACYLERDDTDGFEATFGKLGG